MIFLANIKMSKKSILDVVLVDDQGQKYYIAM